MTVTKHLTKAVGMPDATLIADQEITVLTANAVTYQNDAKTIRDLLFATLPSGTVDALAKLLLEAIETQHVQLTDKEQK